MSDVVLRRDERVARADQGPGRVVHGPARALLVIDDERAPVLPGDREAVHLALHVLDARPLGDLEVGQAVGPAVRHERHLHEGEGLLDELQGVGGVDAALQRGLLRRGRGRRPRGGHGDGDDDGRRSLGRGSAGPEEEATDDDEPSRCTPRTHHGSILRRARSAWSRARPGRSEHERALGARAGRSPRPRAIVRGLHRETDRALEIGEVVPEAGSPRAVALGLDVERGDAIAPVRLPHQDEVTELEPRGGVAGLDGRKLRDEAYAARRRGHRELERVRLRRQLAPVRARRAAAPPRGRPRPGTRRSWTPSRPIRERDAPRTRRARGGWQTARGGARGSSGGCCRRCSRGRS